jgi:polar amino acid transport system substrate-binding protein
MSATFNPGTLVVASACPDPPFELMENGVAAGFDIQLMQAVSVQMGLSLKRVRFTGDNFNDIFDGLENGTWDVVISGTTITPDRSARVLFSQPYAEFNQGVAINRQRTPNVSSAGDLRGLTAGIQSGNTSDAVARCWLAEGLIAGIHYYPYDGIATALDDLVAGRIGFVVKLFPVISWLVKNRPQLSVAMQVPTHEQIGIAYARHNVTLRDQVERAIETLRANGEFARLQAHWFSANT